MTYQADPALEAAVAALPPDACPLLTPVRHVKVRRTPQSEWVEVASTDTDLVDIGITQMLLDGVFNGLTLLDPASLRTSYEHLEPCPLCERRAAPGPVRYGLIHGDGTSAREGFPVPLLLFANDDVATDQAQQLARLRGEHRGQIGRTEVLALTVPAAPAQRPAMRPLFLGEGAELWLWDCEPADADDLPDRVWLIGEGEAVLLAGQQAEQRRPVPVPLPWTSPFRRENQGPLTLTWFHYGPGCRLLVSTLDQDSTEPAVRVTAEGIIVLPDCPRGLRVYGHGVNDRPLLSELPRLGPRFAHLAPA